ncbi:MAG: nucleoside transporter C-terminal domain-containing protein, partial [Pseudomonadota bacterium]
MAGNVKGTSDGVKLLINIIAMLIVLVALVSLINQGLYFLPEFGDQPITLQGILGVVMAPLTFFIGIPYSEILTTGSLMGTKVVRSKIIMTYAMCGFANIGSLGIMIGGMTAMSPEKRDEIISLGVKSVFAGVSYLIRNRFIYALVMPIVVMLGIGSRAYFESLPYFISTYAGDTLWALMAFLVIGLIFPSLSTV